MKKMACVSLTIIMLLSLSIPVSASDISTSQEEEYYAIVDELNTLYDAKITLYSIPQNMSVEEFRETMTSMAVSSAQIKSSLNQLKENGFLQTPISASTRSETVNIGKAADAYVMLVCKNVIIDVADNGDRIFTSAVSSNIYSREAHPFLTTVIYTMSEKHAVIYDRGISLELSAVGDLTVRDDTTYAVMFEMDDYATSVQCNTNDTVWM